MRTAAEYLALARDCAALGLAEAAAFYAAAHAVAAKSEFHYKGVDNED